jgi:hypothetical protein
MEAKISSETFIATKLHKKNFKYTLVKVLDIFTIKELEACYISSVYHRRMRQPLEVYEFHELALILSCAFSLSHIAKKIDLEILTVLHVLGTPQ